MQYFVYKYIYGDDVIYVGRTNDIRRRVKEHASGQGIEQKFVPYLHDVDIYYHQCSSEAEMCAVEFLLINQHKPILNEQDMLSQDCTVNLHMKWDYLSPFGELDVDALEHELAMTHRNILSNQTRIAAYQQEAKELEQLMRDIRPFYEYLNANIQNLANNPSGLFEIPDGMILPGAGVYIGESYIDHWCDERVAKDSKTFIEFSGELLLALFAATKYDDWIAKTIYEVGEKQCRLILEKATNLERRNEALNAKMEVLQKHLGSDCVT